MHTGSWYIETKWLKLILLKEWTIDLDYIDIVTVAT